MSGAAELTGFGLVAATGNEPVALEPVVGRSAGGGRVAAIAGFDIGAYVARKGTRHLSRTSQLACAAASRLAPALGALPAERVGVVFGSAWAALDTIVRFEREAFTEGVRFVDPLLFTETVPNVPAGQVSIVFGWSALNVTLGGPTAGLEAIAWGIDLLEERRASAIVAGGADALHAHLVRVLGERREGDEGLSCGEAACLVSLEPPGSACVRGVEPLGRIAATAGRALSGSEDEGAACDALLEELLAGARLGREAIDLAVSAGPGPVPTAGRGVATSRAAGSPWVTLPSQLGRTWAAAGPLAVVGALAELRRLASARRAPARGVVVGRGDRELVALLVEAGAR
jgi:3-oxoacyl-(acyl-carrier-protein) synthase